MKKKVLKNITLDDLAAITATGFLSVEKKLDSIGDRLDTLKIGLGTVEHELKAVKSNVNNYLELSEKRYSELKQRDALLAK